MSKVYYWQHAVAPKCAELKQFRLARIVPGHCTGRRAVNALVNAFGEEVVVPAAVGRRYSF